MPGILTSIRTTSGRSSSARAMPSSPSEASPTTSMSSWTSRKVRSPRRTTWWSSTSSTRIAPPRPPPTAGAAAGPGDPSPPVLVSHRAPPSRSAVPLPGSDSTVSLPPTPPARSRMETRPRWRPARRTGRGSNPRPSSAIRSRAPWPFRGGPARRDGPAPECRSALCSASWATRSTASSWAAGRARTPPAREGDARGVGAVQHLGLGAQGGDQAVLVQAGGAQLDDRGPQFVGGLRGERGRPACSSSLARAGSRSTRAVAAWAVSRSEKSFWATASCSSWAMPGALPDDGQLAAALVEPGVGQRDGGVLGEHARAAPRRPR